VTDGQLPLRQCLHPESSAKDIHLPSYYWKFSDLKKEYPQTKPDLSRALIPIADVMKLPNMPAPSAPTTISSLADILSGELIFFSRELFPFHLRHIFFFVYAVHDLFQILFFVYDI
jgi:epithelial splicing regulatory protein 1/2